MPAENSNLPLTQEEIDAFLARIQVVGRAAQASLGVPQDFTPTDFQVFQGRQPELVDDVCRKLGIKPRELANAVVDRIEATGFV